jgi:hypothetical protein
MIDNAIIKLLYENLSCMVAMPATISAAGTSRRTFKRGSQDTAEPAPRYRNTFRIAISSYDPLEIIDDVIFKLILRKNILYGCHARHNFG